MQSSTWYCTTCGAANDGLDTRCFACAQPQVEDSTIQSSPDMLLGRYRLLTQVGVGGFGVVYKAADTQHEDQIVAIKQINLRGLSPQKMIEATDAFNREVQHLTPLQHPNLPRIYDHFTDPDHWYLVMEFIEGETLEQYLETRPSRHTYTGNRTFLPLEEIFPLAFQLCDVLTYLHTRHPPVIFRDIKPANIMHTVQGHLYLIDFGIARYFKPGQARDTTPLGSPGYAAPEQYGKAQTTPRTDLYSLGALLHHLLTGEDPAETLFEFSPLPQVVEAEMQLQRLDALIRRMIDTDSEQRPASASAVKEELQSIARLASKAAPRIWYPPEGQLPPPSIAHETFTLASARQQQIQAQKQKPRGTSRRKFITRSIAGGAIAIIGTTVVGSVLVNLSSSLTSPKEIISASTYPTPVQRTSNPPIAWSPDGRYVALVSPDGSFVEVYAIYSNGRVVYFSNLQFNSFYDSVSALAWSPDGSRIATVSTMNGIEIWLIQNSSVPVNAFPLNDLDDHGTIDSISWSPNSRLLAMNDPQYFLRINDAQTGKIIFKQPMHPNSPRVFSWSPDSNHFVFDNGAPDRSSLRVWSITNSAPQFILATLPDVHMIKASWSPDGTTIATLGDDEQLYLWNARDGSLTTTISETPGNYADLFWSPDGRSIAFVLANGNLRVWHKQNNHGAFFNIQAAPERAWLWLKDGRIALVDETKTLQYLKVD